MTPADSLAQVLPIDSESNSVERQANNSESAQSLRDSVAIAMGQYLKELDGQMATDVYDMVLAQIEVPLLEAVMEYTRNNQTKASIMLGLNRGTLRKKLKQYNLITADKA